MARLLQPSDALRCLLGGTVQGTNRAFPRAWLAGQRGWLPLPMALVRESLQPRPDRASLVSWHTTFRYSLTSARARVSTRVWEIHRLHATDAATQSTLLEALVTHASSQGVERLFLRIAADDPLGEAARSSQFMPCVSEVLLVGHHQKGPSTQPACPFRPREPRDEQPLFQLYCATTPAAVRAAFGMTLDQWRDAQERRAMRREEWVAEKDGKVCLWGCLEFRGQGYDVSLLAHPECPELLATAADHALSRVGRYTFLVPEHQDGLGRLLLARGFQEAGRYTMLVRAMAARVQSPSLAPVRA